MEINSNWFSRYRCFSFPDVRKKKRNFGTKTLNQGNSDVGDSFLVFPDLCFSGAIYVMDETVGFL